jgi:hypothetical protein
MASPAALGALLAALQAELARRARTADDDAERLLGQLQEMGQRLLPQHGAALAEELLQAVDDRARFDKIREREDLAIAEAAALMLAQDQGTALRFLDVYQAEAERSKNSR